MAANEEGEQPEQVEHEGDHERRLWPDGAGESITCRADDVLAKDWFVDVFAARGYRRGALSPTRYPEAPS